MVVLVLITSCQVSLYWEGAGGSPRHDGQYRSNETIGLPHRVAALRAKVSNHSLRAGKPLWFLVSAGTMRA